MSWIKNSLLLSFSIAISLFIIDYAILKIFPNWFVERDPAGNQYRFYKYDEILGWNNLSNISGLYSRDEFSYEIKTNAQGARDAEFKPPSEGLDILALGDSYVWGIGVAYGERFTEILEKNKGINEVRNYGVSGFGQLQQYLQLEHQYSTLEGADLVILTICLANDILDNIHPRRYGYLKPYATISDDDNLKLIPIAEGANGNFGSEIGKVNDVYLFNGLRTFLSNIILKIKTINEEKLYYHHLYSHSEDLNSQILKDRVIAYKVFEKLIVKIKNKVEHEGVDFLVLLAPTKYEIGLLPANHKDEVRNTISTILERNQINFIDPSDNFTEKDFWVIDGHWRPSGHHKIAEAINVKIFN